MNLFRRDINAERLAFARSLGADSTHMMAVGSTDADGADAQLRRVAADISQALGRQPRAAVECSGAESSIQLGVHVRSFPTPDYSSDQCLFHVSFDFDSWLKKRG